jgi:hypothetical protein
MKTNPKSPATIRERSESLSVDSADTSKLSRPLHSFIFYQGKIVIRIDGYYLYRLGNIFRQLRLITPDATVMFAIPIIFSVEAELDSFLHQSVFRVKTSLRQGESLLAAVRYSKKFIESQDDLNKPIGYPYSLPIVNELNNFEAVLAAEFGLADFYLVSKKRGYDTTDLIENGEKLFPDDLVKKVPEAIADVKQGARCLAFELNTASAFHFHRANESVLHRYYDLVTGGKPRPDTRNMGDYLRNLDQYKVGEPKIIEALKALKNLHRNPLVHPEHSISTTDEAIAILGSIHAVVVSMLDVLPYPAALSAP